MDAHRRQTDNTQRPAGKQRIAMLLQKSLVKVSIAVQNRNSMILDTNAAVWWRDTADAAGRSNRRCGDGRRAIGRRDGYWGRDLRSGLGEVIMRRTSERGTHGL